MREAGVEDDPVRGAEAHRIAIDDLGIAVFGNRPEAATGFSLVPIDWCLRAKNLPCEMRISMNKEIEIREINFRKFHGVHGGDLGGLWRSQHPHPRITAIAR